MSASVEHSEVKQPLEKPWLNAFYDPTASLYTFSQCLSLADLHGDGDYKLIVADLGTGAVNMKLKVYKGTNVVSENVLIDIPAAVVTFHMDSLEPRVPAIGVASGAHIYVYKNLRPYFKFTLPSLDINPAENDIWMQARDEKVDVITIREVLEGIRNEIGEAVLTSRSQKFLMIDPEEMVEFTNTHKSQPLKKQTLITCLNTLKKSMNDEDAVSCLVLGTESQQVHILDPQAFTILSSASLPSVPVFLCTIGLFDVEYKITVSCRDGCIYTLKRDSKLGRCCIELTYQPTSIVTIAKNIIVGCTDQSIQCYSTKGKQMWSHKMADHIMAMEVIELRLQGITLLAVALANCKIFFYSERLKVGELETEEVVTAMKFGRFGREDNTLIMVTKGGSLIVKILKRTAQFEEDRTRAVESVPSSKLGVPKRTKLFVDQTMRERENFVGMHRVYQQDLYKLRVNTARCFVEALETSLNPISSDPNNKVKLSARVQGLGPQYCVKVELQNTCDRTACKDLLISLICDPEVYCISKTLVLVPMIVPGIQLVFPVTVTCVKEQTLSNCIKIFVFKSGKTQPIVAATINMPISEPWNCESAT